MFLTGQAEVDKAVAKITDAISCMPAGSCGDLLALPLYAALPPELQVPPQNTLILSDTSYPAELQVPHPNNPHRSRHRHAHTWRDMNAGALIYHGTMIQVHHEMYR